MPSFAWPPPPPAVDDPRALTKPELVHLDHFLHPPPRLSRSKQRFSSLHRIERVAHPRKRPRERRLHLVGRLVEDTLATNRSKPAHDTDPFEVPRPHARAALADAERQGDLIEAERTFAGEQQTKHPADAQREPVLPVEVSDVIGDLKP